MGKAQDDEARPVVARVPRRAAHHPDPSPGRTGTRAALASPGPVRPGPPRERSQAPRPRAEGGVPPAPIGPDTLCTRGRRAGPPEGASRLRPASGRDAPVRGSSALRAHRSLRPPRRRVRGRPLREPLAPPGRARPRPVAPVIVAAAGERASSGPTSAAGDSPGLPTRFSRAPSSPAAGACVSRSLPSPATACAVHWS